MVKLKREYDVAHKPVSYIDIIMYAGDHRYKGYHVANQFMFDVWVKTIGAYNVNTIYWRYD